MYYNLLTLNFLILSSFLSFSQNIFPAKEFAKKYSFERRTKQKDIKKDTTYFDIHVSDFSSDSLGNIVIDSAYDETGNKYLVQDVVLCLRMQDSSKIENLSIEVLLDKDETIPFYSYTKLKSSEPLYSSNFFVIGTLNKIEKLLSRFEHLDYKLKYKIASNKKWRSLVLTIYYPNKKINSLGEITYYR